MTPIEQMKADAAMCNEAVFQSQYCNFRQTPPHILERREKIKSLSDQGLSHRAIAARLKVSRPTVAKDLRAIEAEDAND